MHKCNSISGSVPSEFCRLLFGMRQGRFSGEDEKHENMGKGTFSVSMFHGYDIPLKS